MSKRARSADEEPGELSTQLACLVKDVLLQVQDHVLKSVLPENGTSSRHEMRQVRRVRAAPSSRETRMTSLARQVLTHLVADMSTPFVGLLLTRLQARPIRCLCSVSISS